MTEPKTTVERRDEGGWSLNHGYYGLVDESVSAWSIEYITPNTEAAARELAARDTEITALLERQMSATVDKAHSTPADFGRGGAYAGASLADMSRLIFGRAPGDEAKPRLRLTATKSEDGSWVISDYDYSAWEAAL